MFSSSKTYFKGIERHSNEMRLEDGARRNERHDEVEGNAGTFVVRRTVRVRAYTHFSPDVDMYFVPPHPTHGEHLSLRGSSELGGVGGRSAADRLVEEIATAAAEHDAEVARLAAAATELAAPTADTVVGAEAVAA